MRPTTYELRIPDDYVGYVNDSEIDRLRWTIWYSVVPVAWSLLSIRPLDGSNL